MGTIHHFQEDIHTSRIPSQIPPCNHLIHKVCLLDDSLWKDVKSFLDDATWKDANISLLDLLWRHAEKWTLCLSSLRGKINSLVFRFSWFFQFHYPWFPTHIGNWPNDFSCQWWTCRMCGRSMTEKSQRHRCQVKLPQLRLDPIITLSFQGEYQNMACAVQCRDCLKEGLGKFHILGTEKKQASHLILNST